MEAYKEHESQWKVFFQ